MDPLSVAASAVSLALLVTKLGQKASLYGEQIASADNTLHLLTSEMTTLGATLASMDSTLKNNNLDNAFNKATSSKEVNKHLGALEDILQDCKKTLVEFEAILDELKKGRFSSSFFRKSTRAWKINQKTPHLSRIQHLVSGYHRAMQIHLQLMNLLLATQTSAGIQDVDSSLDGIKSEILRLRFHLTSLNERENLDGQTLTSESIKQSLATSEHVLTSASEYLGSTAGTISLNNTSPVNFSADRAAQVEEWILLEDDNDDTNNPSVVDDHSDSEEDREMILELISMAESHYEKSDFQNAKRFFITFLLKLKASPMQHEVEIIPERMKLSHCHTIDEEYNEAFLVLNEVDVDHCSAGQLYAIRQLQAEILYMAKDFEKAKQHVKLAMKAPQGSSKGSEEYNNSMTLLSMICDGLGQAEEAEVYKARVPASFQPKRSLGWKDPKQKDGKKATPSTPRKANDTEKSDASARTAAVELQAVTGDILEPLLEEMPSERTSTPTNVTFINRTRSTRISIYWIDWESNAKHYVDVDAGTSNLRPTYIDHVWKVLDWKNRRLIGVYVAKANDASVVITDDMELKPIQTEPYSRPLHNATNLTFVNYTNSTIKLFWIDFAGNTKLYAEVHPGGRNVRPTYASHVWRVCDDAGNKIASYVAPLGDSTVVIRSGGSPWTEDH